MNEVATVIHAVSATIGMLVALSTDVLFNFYSRDRKISTKEFKVMLLSSKIVWYSLFLMFVSGIAIFLGNVEKYINSGEFLAKMTIVAILTLNGYLLGKVVVPHMKKKAFLQPGNDYVVRKVAFASGAVSIVSWISAYVIGSWDIIHNNYLIIMTAYLTFMLVSVAVALLAESIKF